MGTTGTKNEVQKIKTDHNFKSHKKRLYFNSNTEAHISYPEKDQTCFTIHLKPMEPNCTTLPILEKLTLKEKKKDSPRKKCLKNEGTNEMLEKVNFALNTQNTKSQMSPRLKHNRNSISYNGEFAITLKPVTGIANEETKENRKMVKDLNCFELLKVIGRGTFGKVVLVRNKMDNQLLALKCIKKGQILKNKNIENIKNEKKVLENLDNPFIIKLHYTFQNKDKIFMAFDYYNGGELFFHLQKQRRFSENIARFYAAEIYVALQDLKPENIILDKLGHIKLIDFGLAKGRITSTNLTWSVCGTNEYIPPEVIRGKSYGFKFDWWGFGNILYEMLYGYPPFNDQNKYNLFKKIVNCEPSYRGAEISSDALNLIKRLLKKEPSDRIKPEDIPSHPWFKGINFEEIKEMKINPPFKPRIKNEEDLSNIDPAFLNECINSPVKSFNLIFDESKFKLISGYFSDF